MDKILKSCQISDKHETTFKSPTSPKNSICAMISSDLVNNVDATGTAPLGIEAAIS